MENLVQSQLDQPAISNEPDVFLDLSRRQALDGPLLKSQVDEGILVRPDGGAS